MIAVLSVIVVPGALFLALSKNTTRLDPDARAWACKVVGKRRWWKRRGVRRRCAPEGRSKVAIKRDRWTRGRAVGETRRWLRDPPGPCRRVELIGARLVTVRPHWPNVLRSGHGRESAVGNPSPQERELHHTEATRIANERALRLRLSCG
ncbi:hypothetical protein C8Q72DRAFT_181093 [Fomitopsis betulina]|nr:hypothetical protein C8Q72DRAFT_181093 [Fomitopsis betulina]